MNTDTKNLKRFITIFNNLFEVEQKYMELEEYGIYYSANDYFNIFFELAENLDKTINTDNISEHKLNLYKQLMTDIVKRLEYDYPQLYSITSNLTEAFDEAHSAAIESIEQNLLQYNNENLPTFSCGYASLNLYIPELSLLGIFLNKYCTLEDFTYKNGKVSLILSDISKKYNLNAQDYEIYIDAYNSCLRVLEKKLQVKGTVESFID